MLSPLKRLPPPSQQADARIAQTEQIVFDATVALVTELGPPRSPSSASPPGAGWLAARSIAAGPTSNRLFVDAFKALTALPPMPLTGRLDEDLETFAHQYARELDDPAFFSVVIFLLDEWRGSKRYRSLARSITRQRQRRAAAIVRAAIARGELSPDVDPMAVADAIMAPLFHRRVGRHQLASTLDVVAVVVVGPGRRPRLLSVQLAVGLGLRRLLLGRGRRAVVRRRGAAAEPGEGLRRAVGPQDHRHRAQGRLDSMSSCLARRV